MRWGQISAGLAVAIIAASATTEGGYGFNISILIGILAYLLTRWTIAWVFRVRYWLREDGYDRRRCPECNQSIYRLAGDWVLRCHRCGWTVGWPGVRWFTRSVPAQQLKRTVVGPGLALAVIVAALLLITVTGGVPLENGSGENGIENNRQSADDVGGIPVDIGNTDESSGESTSDYNVTQVEQMIHELLNDRRLERSGYSRLSWNDRATRAARAHAGDMAEHDYFSHTSLDGETQRERYSFCNGGENIAQTWVDRRVTTSEDTTRITSEQELAKNIIQMWMNSDPHREDGIYGEFWESGGVGVAISDEGKVFAVYGFCQ